MTASPATIDGARRRARRPPWRLHLALALLASSLAPSSAMPARAAAPSAPIIADVQVREVTVDQRYLVQVRSTALQPFDVLPSPAGVVRVRLHGAQLGAVSGTEAAPFGTMSLQDESGGSVLLRIDLADPGYRVRVGQGGNATTVDIQLSR